MTFSRGGFGARIRLFIGEEALMRCEIVQDNLGPYVRGELLPDERRVMDAHLQGCRACRAS